MRHKLLNLIVVLIFLVFGKTSAQTMYVREISGVQTAHSLSSIRKLTFSDGNVFVHKTNNASGVYALSELRYLNFTDLIFDQTNFVVFPNPVIDILTINISNLIGKCKISIATLDGKIIQTLNTNGDSFITFNIGDLSSGIYLFHFENELEIKTLKITKQ